MSPTDELPEKERFSVSRRDFLKTAGVGSLATAVTTVGAAEAEARTGAKVVGPGDVPVSLMVNGKRIDLKIEPRVTLLDALRNRADLTGYKRVCDRGTCGACTMIVDGRTVYSCSTLAIECRASRSAPSTASPTATTLHPVQQAFCDNDALMCGFCTPGFVVATVGAAREESEADARPGEEGARRQHLPLRHVRTHHGSGADGAKGWLVAEVQGRARPAAPKAAEPPALAGEIQPWPEKPAVLEHAREAARRPRQGIGSREVHLRHQSSRDDLRQDRPLAAIRTPASSRST